MYKIFERDPLKKTNKNHLLVFIEVSKNALISQDQTMERSLIQNVIDKF